MATTRDSRVDDQTLAANIDRARLDAAFADPAPLTAGNATWFLGPAFALQAFDP
jgi:hypothetical protein